MGLFLALCVLFNQCVHLPPLLSWSLSYNHYIYILSSKSCNWWVDYYYLTKKHTWWLLSYFSYLFELGSTVQVLFKLSTSSHIHRGATYLHYTRMWLVVILALFLFSYNFINRVDWFVYGKNTKLQVLWQTNVIHSDDQFCGERLGTVYITHFQPLGYVWRLVDGVLWYPDVIGFFFFFGLYPNVLIKFCW